jgi:hypothetical protein
MKAKSGAVLLLVVAFSSPAWSFEFSGERIFRQNGKEVVASVQSKSDRWRLEYSQPQAGAMATIVRLDRQYAWLIMSKQRLYMEVPIASEHLLMVNETMQGEVSRELIGTENLNGYPTELYEVTATAKGSSRQYYQWVTQEHRFAMKTISKQEGWSLEYRKVIFAKQSDLYFETPRGYVLGNPPRKSNDPALAP